MQADILDRLLVTLAVRLRAFSVCRIQRGWRLNFSSFDAVTVHFVLRGSASLQVAGGSWQSFAPHAIIVIPPGQSHALGESERCVGEARAEDHCSLHGDGLVSFTAGEENADTLLICGQIADNYSGAMGLFELFQTAMVETFPVDYVLHRSFELMLAEVDAPSLGTQAMTEVLMKQCLIIFLRRHLDSSTFASPLIIALQHPHLARAILAVIEQPGALHSVETLATHAGMGRTAFAERFSAAFDVGPMQFVQRVRLRVAARLLTGTDIPMKVIAASVGYASRSSFSKVFETEFGLPPSQYRRVGSQDEAESERIHDVVGNIAEEASPESI